MATFTITGEPREVKGKGGARKLRAQALIPAIVYGKGEEPVAIQIGRRDFMRTVSGHSLGNMIIDLSFGNDPVKAVIRDIQIEPVSREVLHIDFNRISMTEKILIEVPLELVGVAIGVKNFGGILAHPIRTLTVSCFANDVPEKIEVDISELGLNDSIHVSDLKEDFEIVADDDVLIASVATAKAEVVKEEETEEGAEAAAAEGAEGEEKKAEEKTDEKTKG